MDAKQKIEKEKEIVIAQLQTAPPDLGFFDGDGGATYSRDDIIRGIQENDPVGLEYVKSQFEFLRAIARGEVQKKIMEVHNSHVQNSSDHESGS